MNNKTTLFTTTGVTNSNRLIHTPGEFAKKNLLYVQEVGVLESLQPHKSQRESLESFLILCILSGKGKVTIENKIYDIRKGDCAFIDCRKSYSHESSEDNPWELMWVHFNGNNAEAYYNLYLEKNKDGIFRPVGLKVLKDIIDKLMKYQKEKDLESDLLSGELLVRILNLTLTSVINKEQQNYVINKNLYNEIREYINEKYEEENLIDLLNQLYNTSETELDTWFRKAYGIGLRDYILNRRFTVAKELLRFTIKPISEIIQESGIKYEDLFRKLFQDGEGMSAEDYRMKWSQWVK